MCKLKQLKSREEHPKRNRQNIALLLTLTILLTVVLSGCLGSEKPSDAEKQYWGHIDEVSRLSAESQRLWEVIMKTKITESGELLNQMKENHKKALVHARKAVEIAPDEQSRNYAFYLSKALEYTVQVDEKYLEMKRLYENGDREGGKEIERNELNPLQELALEMLDEADKYKPKRRG